MSIFPKIVHSVVLTSNFGVVLAMILCGNAHLFEAQHVALISFLSYGFVPLFIVNLFFLFYWVLRLKMWALLSIFGILLTWNSFQAWIPINNSETEVQTLDQSIKVLTYNVEYFQNKNLKVVDGVSSIVSYIQKVDADIVCLQEAGPDFVSSGRFKPEMNKALKAYKYFVSGEQENRFSVVLLSKYPILKTKRIEYQSKSNSSFYYDLKVGKDTIRLINNHLESNKLNPKEKDKYSDLIRNPESNQLTEVASVLRSKIGNATVIRTRQADSVSQVIKNSPYKTIVCGDFNDTPGSYTYRKIRESLQDAWVKKGTGWGHTFHEHFFLFRIDYVLYSSDFKCVEVKRDKVNYSDHYPIWAILKMI